MLKRAKDVLPLERELTYIVPLQEAGLRLQTILRQRLGFSAAQVKRLKQCGGILCNGQPAFATRLAQAGDCICCRLPQEAPSPHIQPVPGPVCIRYEDADLLVLDKAAGVPVHPSQGHFTDSLANHLAYVMEQRGTPFVFRAVNRLDRNTSGLLVVAKHAHAHSLLGQMLHSGAFHREYLALVCGAVRPRQGVVDAPILDVPGQLARRVDPGGARAVTHYETLVEGGPYALLRLWLETGRTHQIRVHMASIGHPLAGDFLYGTECRQILQVHALHASRICLRQPITGQAIQVESPLPQPLAALLPPSPACRP